MSTSAQSPDPKKKRRFGQYLQNIKDSFTISRRTYPWIGWALGGIALAVVALGVLIALLTNQALWYWLVLAIPMAGVGCMALLAWTTRHAAYTQMEGRPGAAKWVLDQAIGRGWFVESDPAAINPKTQDVIWRVVGRPGVVLVVEGPVGRTQKMADDEGRKIRRILSTVPLHVINVGPGKGQTRLLDLSRTLRKLPTKPTRLTDNEIAQVSKRLSSLSSKGLPIPKGIDPMRARPDRRALRGR